MLGVACADSDLPTSQGSGNANHCSCDPGGQSHHCWGCCCFPCSPWDWPDQPTLVVSMILWGKGPIGGACSAVSDWGSRINIQVSHSTPARARHRVCFIRCSDEAFVLVIRWRAASGCTVAPGCCLLLGMAPCSRRRVVYSETIARHRVHGFGRAECNPGARMCDGDERARHHVAHVRAH